MRKAKTSHFTPLMRISIVLTAGILIGKVCYGYTDTFYWLVAGILSWGIALALYLRRKTTEKELALQCIFLYLCIAGMGILNTCLQMDKQQAAPEVVSVEDLSSLDRTLLNAQTFRNHISKEMQHLGIHDQDFAVVSAMTLGDKTALNKETKDIYSISGASHVLAVSGLHIGIIFQLFILLMGGRKRSLLSISISLIAIWAYVVFIGMPASAVRSATMISICCFALLAHKKAISLNNLCFAYVIMLFANPLYLFDISFQMSFAAVFSILLFAPVIKDCFTLHGKGSLYAKKNSAKVRNEISKWIGGMFCLSLAAQIGTMPLIVYYFGRISCYSLFTGFIAIPAATAILYLSAAALILSAFTMTPWIAILATPLLHFTASCLASITQACNTALQLTTLLPMSSIEGIKISIPQLCLIYFGIIAGYIFLRKASVLWNRS